MISMNRQEMMYIYIYISIYIYIYIYLCVCAWKFVYYTIMWTFQQTFVRH